LSQVNQKAELTPQKKSILHPGKFKNEFSLNYERSACILEQATQVNKLFSDLLTSQAQAFNSNKVTLFEED